MILQSAACLFLSTAVHCDQLRFLWTVGSSKESRAMLLKFGVNAQAIPTVPRVALEDINEYFTTCESDSRQQSTVRKTLERLCVVGTRNYVIALDETYWSPTYDLLPAGTNKTGILIGGPWGHGNLNLSRLSSAEGKNVDHSTASRLSLSFCIARADTSSHVYDVNLTPIAPGSGSSKSSFFLDLLDQLLANCVLCHGCPPIGCAWDGGLSNAKIGRFFLGMVSPAELDSSPRFFARCQVIKPKLPYWLYGALKYDSQFFVFGNTDLLHQLKRLSLNAFDSTRTLTFGSCQVSCLGHHLNHGLALQAFTCSDRMSDKQALQRLCAGHLSNHPADCGAALVMLLSALLSSAWLGCKSCLAFN